MQLNLQIRSRFTDYNGSVLFWYLVITVIVSTGAIAAGIYYRVFLYRQSKNIPYKIKIVPQLLVGWVCHT